MYWLSNTLAAGCVQPRPRPNRSEKACVGRQPNPAVLALPAPEGWSGQRAESQALALLASGALTAAAKPLALPAPADWAPVASSEAHKKQSRVPLTPIDGGVKRSAEGGASNFKRRRL